MKHVNDLYYSDDNNKRYETSKLKSLFICWRYHEIGFNSSNDSLLFIKVQ